MADFCENIGACMRPDKPVSPSQSSTSDLDQPMVEEHV
eukprot:CAMPEP_0179431602 /NCGR_PEP_ID=MMETSP0799-20121207/16452_1 /TAXON_ID=46947 /ORGANISM="Geminigera cryophila, Strain CCMP2564" /LENGTH=37 /DNA_ID= /DNA_START= /DNA_END= /DNA_ORIENTATION=